MVKNSSISVSLKEKCLLRYRGKLSFATDLILYPREGELITSGNSLSMCLKSFTGVTFI